MFVLLICTRAVVCAQTQDWRRATTTNTGVQRAQISWPTLGEKNLLSDDNEPPYWPWWFNLLFTLGMLGIFGLLYKSRMTQLKAEKTAVLALLEGEARYHRLTENAQDIIFRLSLPDRRVEYINPAIIDLSGYTPQEFYKSPQLITDIIHPDWRHDLEIKWRDMLKSMPPPFFEYQIVDKIGETKWVYQRNVPIYNAENQLIAVEGTITNITARKEAEHEIQRQNRNLAMLNHIITATTSTLDTRKILEVLCTELATTFSVPQAAATRLDPTETTATVIAEYLDPGRPSALGATFAVQGNPASMYIIEHKQALFIADAQHDERLGDSRAEMQRRNTVSLLLIPIVIRDRVVSTVGLDAIEPRIFTEEEIALAQSAAAAVGHALETAELYQTLQHYTDELENMVEQRTRELQAAMERAQAADRVKSEFVSNVSHELRTPLTNIKLYFDLVRRGREDKRTFYMDTVSRETDRLQSLIENLLNISRLDLGKITARLKPVDINQLVTTLVQDRQQLFVEQGLELTASPSAIPLPMISIDAKLIEQVITNLLSNAFNYTPSGGSVWLRTELAYDEGRAWVTISVKDTGPGIPPEEQAQLFTRFYRGKAGTENNIPGTGLGLAICREILDLHQGHITLKSKPGQGSTFTIWLPCTDENHPRI